MTDHVYLFTGLGSSVVPSFRDWAMALEKPTEDLPDNSSTATISTKEIVSL